MGGSKEAGYAEAVADLAERIAESRKYRHVSADTVTRVSRWALDRYPPRVALKKAKTKLHQIWGAFASEAEVDRAGLLVADIEKDPSGDTRGICARILDLHSSTRERQDFLPDLYDRVFRVTGCPAHILDIGCGLHPFSIPFMAPVPAPDCVAWDIDKRLVELVGRFFKAAGLRGTAECRDILLVKPAQALPTTPRDLVLLLKILPSLEQEAKGSALKVLDGFKTAWMLVSYPAVSMGGDRREDMRAHWHREFGILMETLGLRFETLEFPTETFYLVSPASS